MPIEQHHTKGTLYGAEGALAVETPVGTLVAEDVSDDRFHEVCVTLVKPDGTWGVIAYVGVTEDVGGACELHALAYDGSVDGPRGEDGQATWLVCDPNGEAMGYPGRTLGRDRRDESEGPARGLFSQGPPPSRRTPEGP